MTQLKPEACIVGDRLAVFLGADYKYLTLDQADALIAKLQGLAAALRRKQKRDRRAAKAAILDYLQG